MISISYTGGEKGSQDAIEQARIGRGSFQSGGSGGCGRLNKRGEELE